MSTSSGYSRSKLLPMTNARSLNRPSSAGLPDLDTLKELMILYINTVPRAAPASSMDQDCLVRSQPLILDGRLSMKVPHRASASVTIYYVAH